MSAAVMMYKADYNTSTVSGSVIQPLGMEREELRVFHWVLLVVFLVVFMAGILLIIGICKVRFQLLIFEYIYHKYVSSKSQASTYPGLPPPLSP